MILHIYRVFDVQDRNRSFFSQHQFQQNMGFYLKINIQCVPTNLESNFFGCPSFKAALKGPKS